MGLVLVRFEEEIRMEQYKKMYAILCKGASDTLDALPYLPENILARCLLEKSLAEAEEIYLEAEGMEAVC